MENLYSSLEQQYDLPPGSLTAVRKIESGGNSKAVSNKGAQGDFQFMPETAVAYGVDPSDPVSSATGAAKYLSDLTKKYGSFQAALAHYNGGTKAGKAVSEGKEAPYKETKDYLGKVNNNMRIDPNLIKFDDEINPSNVKMDVNEIDPSKIVLDTGAGAGRGGQGGPTAEQMKEANPSWISQFGKGLAVSAENTKLGAEQLYNKGEQLFGSKNAAEHEKQLNEAIARARQENAPILNTTAGQVGNFTGEFAKALPLMAIPGAGTVAGGALVGGALSALQPTLPEENKAFNIGAGMALGGAGQGIVNALGRVAQPIQNQLGEIANNAVRTLREAGVPLDAAQASGSKLLQRVKAALSDNPITAGAQEEFSGVQKAAYNKAVAKTMGENADRITPDVIQRAKDRLGKVYEDVSSRNSIYYDDTLKNSLSSIRGEAEQVLNPTQFATVDKQIQNIIDKAESQGGGLHGEQYSAVKKVLDKLSGSNDTDVAAYAREIKDSLLDGLTRTAKETGNEADVRLLQKTNREYGNMKKIEDVVLNDAEGNISPSKLMNSLATKGKRYSFYQDDPQLAKLASAGKVVLPEKLPNSGTTARLLGATALPALGGVGYGLYEGDLAGVGKGVAAGVIAPKLAQAAINNPAMANYLTKGIKNVPLRSLLQAPSQVGGGKIPTVAYANYLQSLQPKEQK